MSYKVTCPGCNTTTTDNTRAFLEGGKCPKCGLSLDVLHEINKVRESHATAEVTKQFEELAIRAGKAEAEAANLKRKLDRIQTYFAGFDWEGREGDYLD